MENRNHCKRLTSEKQRDPRALLFHPENWGWFDSPLSHRAGGLAKYRVVAYFVQWWVGGWTEVRTTRKGKTRPPTTEPGNRDQTSYWCPRWNGFTDVWFLLKQNLKRAQVPKGKTFNLKSLDTGVKKTTATTELTACVQNPNCFGNKTCSGTSALFKH